MIGTHSPALMTVLAHKDLTPTEKLAWIALCEIRPSDSERGSLYRRLAEAMGLEDRYDGGREAVKRAITSLRSKGLIGRTFLAIDPTTGLFAVDVPNQNNPREGAKNAPDRIVLEGVENTPNGVESTRYGVKNTPNGAENTPERGLKFNSSSSDSSPDSLRGVVGGGQISTRFGVPEFEEPFRRTPEDLADVKRARDRLLGSINHQGLAGRLEANHENPEYRDIAGWQWAAAALRIIAIGKVVNLNYLMWAARGFTREAAAEIERQAKSRPDLTPAKAPKQVLDDNGDLVKPLDVFEITDEIEAKFGTWAYTRSFAKLFRQHNGDFSAIMAGGSW